MGALTNCRTIWLETNQFGDAGVSALASALAGGALPACTTITLYGNRATTYEARQTINLLAAPTERQRGHGTLEQFVYRRQPHLCRWGAYHAKRHVQCALESIM